MRAAGAVDDPRTGTHAPAWASHRVDERSECRRQQRAPPARCGADRMAADSAGSRLQPDRRAGVGVSRSSRTAKATTRERAAARLVTAIGHRDGTCLPRRPPCARRGSRREPGDPATAKPGLLKQIGIDQRLQQQVPLDLAFKDETGRDVRLGEYFGKRPVILVLGYYECPMLCTQVLNGAGQRAQPADLRRRDASSTSWRSASTRRKRPALAAQKKQSYMERYKRPHTVGGMALPHRHGRVHPAPRRGRRLPLRVRRRDPAVRARRRHRGAHARAGSSRNTFTGSSSRRAISSSA